MGILNFVPYVRHAKIAMFLTKYLRSADHPYLKGKGGRFGNNMRKSLQGLTFKSLRKHTEIQPLIVIMLGAVTLVTAYGIKLIQAGDINLTKNKDLDKGFYKERHKLVEMKEANSDERKRPDYNK